jgi:hypothetical protein
MDNDRAATLHIFGMGGCRCKRKGNENQAKAGFSDMHSVFP